MDNGDNKDNSYDDDGDDGDDNIFGANNCDDGGDGDGDDSIAVRPPNIARAIGVRMLGVLSAFGPLGVHPRLAGAPLRLG
jgi:hypothetical protein